MAVEEPDTLRYRIAEVGLTMVKGAIKWFPRVSVINQLGADFGQSGLPSLRGNWGFKRSWIRRS
jgi:hypothetical protein